MDFLNDIGKKINEAAKSIATWGRDENAPSDKLAEEIKKAQAELKDRYAELGRACYEKLTGARTSIPEDSISNVRAALDKLTALDERRRKETSRRRCPNCGSFQEGGARFCSACGKPLMYDAARARQEAQEALEYCRECGALRENGEARCPVCDTPFDERPVPDTAPVDAPAAADIDAPEEPEDGERYEE